MPTKVYASLAFTIISLVFMILVFIMYLSKKKYKKLENYIFLFMTILTIILIISEFFYVYMLHIKGIDNFISQFACHTYTFVAILWLACLILYIWALSIKNKQGKAKPLIPILMVILVLFTFGVSFIGDLVLDNNIDLYVFAGTGTYGVYIVGFFVMILVLVTLMKSFKLMKKEQRIPILFTFLMFRLMFALQLGFEKDFNTLTFFYSFIVTTLYFTIESQDYQLVDELKKKKAEAEEADMQKTAFLSNMSHEIRTPLNTILGFSESLLEEKELTKEIVVRDVKLINDASITLLELINNILDISRIESGKETVEEKDYNLQNLIFDINSVISPKINKQVLKFNIKVSDDLPSKYYGDHIKVYKILVCVLLNAIKYTSYGEVNIEINGKEDTDDTYMLNFVISNTGHAMKQEDFNKDFNDFVMLGDDAQNTIDSTTLGLIIAKRLINMLNGEISFVNKPGYGTRYEISIKQKVADYEKIGNVFENKEQILATDQLLDCTGKKILIVDDNRINIKLASKLLEPYNFEIDSALSGQETLEKVKNEKYDLIFLDHMMPEMDGIATMKALKASGYFVPPVIALTANSYTGLKDMYIQNGFSNYLSKPINFKELNKVINEIFKSDK